jgi:cytochrome c5
METDKVEAVMKNFFLLVVLFLTTVVPLARAKDAHAGKKNAATRGEFYVLGRRVYEKACAKCHRNGIAGAPKLGDRDAWSFRLAQGTTTLVRHAIDGYMCNRGVLPPRGGDQYLTDREISAATSYMVQQSR